MEILIFCCYEQKCVLSVERGMAVDKAKLFSHADEYSLSEPKKAQRCRRNPSTEFEKLLIRLAD